MVSTVGGVLIIFEEFYAAHENATSRRKRGRILKLILYDSHARGGWVDEPHTATGYVSDFDLLVIVDQKELTDRAAYWTATEQRLIEEKLVERLRTPVNFVVHSWQEVGDGSHTEDSSSSTSHVMVSCCRRSTTGRSRAEARNSKAGACDGAGVLRRMFSERGGVPLKLPF
ncbi:hypothetical protein NOVOSPHI9U_260169 [Novosphingobium sp. 9U]|nr:hypothetical protein NOVOSPHI9U_260169 [Novosphingobium sp. 9U]